MARESYLLGDISIWLWVHYPKLELAQLLVLAQSLIALPPAQLVFTHSVVSDSLQPYATDWFKIGKGVHQGRILSHLYAEHIM